MLMLGMIYQDLIFIRCIYDNPNLIFEETKNPEIAQEESKTGFLFVKNTVKANWSYVENINYLFPNYRMD